MAHVPVLLEEVIEALAIEPNDTLVDGTFGRGGHARAMLEKLGPRGRLLVIDQDPEAIASAQAGIGQDERVTVRHANFSKIAEITQALGWSGAVDGVLLDLGVSSPQLDDPSRGFSFMAEGPLDMRMDPTRGQSAAEWLAHVDEATLAEVIKDYGEERHARRVARAIVEARSSQPIETTAELSRIVSSVVKGRPGHHPATRTFQAIRIFINRELEVLDEVLEDLMQVMAPNGRMAIITFHSLEDRAVKQAWNRLAKPPTASRRAPMAHEFTPALKLIGKSVTASEKECAQNPRARSARLRVAERILEQAA